MGLLPPYITTSNYRVRNKKKSKSLLKAEAEHREFLIRMKAFGSSGKVPRTIPREAPYQRPSPDIPSMNSNLPGVAAKPAEKVYSGERRLLGIATLHKSNMVPVFADKKEDAIDIARMRRG